MMNGKSPPPPPLRVAVAIIVSVVWAAAALVSLYDDRYVPLEIITPVMLLLAGYLFGVQIIRPGRGPTE